MSIPCRKCATRITLVTSIGRDYLLYQSPRTDHAVHNFCLSSVETQLPMNIATLHGFIAAILRCDVTSSWCLDDVIRSYFPRRI